MQSSKPEDSVPRHFLTLVANAFSIVSALAWSEAITGFFEKVNMFRNAPLAGPFVYAILITMLAYLVAKWFEVKPGCTRLCEPQPTPTPTPTPPTR